MTSGWHGYSKNIQHTDVTDQEMHNGICYAFFIVRTEDLYVNGVRSVLLVLRSSNGVDQHITIDRDGLIKAYYGLRTDIQELIGDAGDVLHAMYQLSSQ